MVYLYIQSSTIHWLRLHVKPCKFPQLSTSLYRTSTANTTAMASAPVRRPLKASYVEAQKFYKSLRSLHRCHGPKLISDPSSYN